MSKNKPTKNFNNGGGFHLARVSCSDGKRHCLYDPKTGATSGSILTAWEDSELGYMVSTERSIYIAGHPLDIMSGVKLLTRYGVNTGSVTWDDDTPSSTSVKEESKEIDYGTVVDFIAVILETMTGGILTAKRWKGGADHVVYIGGMNKGLTRSASMDINRLLKGEVNVVFFDIPVREVCRSLENGVTPAEAGVRWSVHYDTFKDALKEACRLLCTM